MLNKLTTINYQLVTLFFMCGAVALAQPTVGKLDGTPGPNLPAIETPALAAVEKMADTTFPTMLEKAGDYPSALLEWQRVAHQSYAEDRLKALLKVAEMQEKTNQLTQAATTLKAIIEEFKPTTQLPQIYTALARTSTGDAYTQLLQTLHQTYAAEPWAQAILMHHVWQQAGQGAVIETYNIPAAQALQLKLMAFNLQQATRQKLVGLIGLFPGAGHLYLAQGNPALLGTGAAMMFVWGLFGLAFLSACRHRHYAYAFVFVFPFVALWLNSPFLAMQQAAKETLVARQLAFPEQALTTPVLTTPAVLPSIQTSPTTP
ncbi:MAG: hypothetical protein EBQ80_03605 [Proteobacteria bacterium]|nr:hypothetical protein [Pseudomonadota bacterium]